MSGCPSAHNCTVNNTNINKRPYNSYKFHLQYTRHLFATVFKEPCKRIVGLLCILLIINCHSITIRCCNIILTPIWSRHLQLSPPLVAGQGHSCARLCWDEQHLNSSHSRLWFSSASTIHIILIFF